MTKMIKTTLGLVLAMLLLTTGVAWGSDLWLHVRVEEGTDTSVNVNVPLSMVEKAIPMLPTDDLHIHDGTVVLDHVDMSLSDLRELWQEVKDSPDMTFVSVQEADESVRVSKQGDYVLVEVDEGHEHGERVDVRVPMSVVDALLSGEGDELRIEDAVRALAAHGPGELVTVQGSDEMVKVWIDNNAAGS